MTRKDVIHACEVDLPLELEDVEADGLVPDAPAEGSVRICCG